jgi:hypothetical protein
MSAQRTKAQLDALFADNESSQISPADLRDFVESCLPSSGGMHFVQPGSMTAIDTEETFVKAENETLQHTSVRFSMPLDNRLQYDGTVPARVLITGTLCAKVVTSNQLLAFAFAVNGEIVESSITRTKVGETSDIQGQTDIHAVPIMAQVIMEPGDYLEVWLSNDSGDADVTIDHGHVHVIGFLL